ncbi:hypothetical protein [Streptomyces sp. C10]|uniref:hypothetical protein n=1 Tax=Streptomyces sp. C10 TaxID=531941 RepID=UPI00397F6422
MADSTDESQSSADHKVHVRLEQCHGRKALTTVDGLSEGVGLEEITRGFREEFSCDVDVFDSGA